MVVLSYYDIRYYRVPNCLIYYILSSFILNKMILNNFSQEMIKYSLRPLFLYLLTEVFLSPVRKFFKMPAGDMKLFGLLIGVLGVDSGLRVIFLSLIFSLIPLSIGVKKVPMALFSSLSCIAFYFFRRIGI